MVSLFIEGDPVPQGSKRAVPTKRGLRVIDQSGAKLKSWREVIEWEARVAWKDKPFRSPVGVEIDFYMKRPKSHYIDKKKGLVRGSAPHWHSVRPDIDKLTRAVLDGITGAIIYDDSLVVSLSVRKYYSPTPGVRIQVHHADLLLAEATWPDVGDI